jgi:hypothetical protein
MRYVPPLSGPPLGPEARRLRGRMSLLLTERPDVDA